MALSEIRASVAMAVYNGEQYICEQIDSILERMGQQDELVISYDVSTDATWQIINDYAKQDSRVRVVCNPGKGGVRNNFTNAVMNCRGEYIFLSDQDDLWIGDKINRMIEKFQQTGADLVVHNGYMTDGTLEVIQSNIFDQFGRYNNPILNIIKCNFWGCCMAFRSHMRQWVCPFPSDHDICHDCWLGIIVGFRGKIARMEDYFIKHRLHGNNVTISGGRSIWVIAKDRIKLVRYLIMRWAGKI